MHSQEGITTIPPAALTPGHGQRGKGLSTILLWLLHLQKDNGLGMFLSIRASLSIFELPAQTQDAKDEQVHPGDGFVCYKHVSSC